MSDSRTKRALVLADRLLLHPWTTRLGALQAVVGGALLAAGLVGGVVTLVFGFPLGWAILSAVGAFLVTSSGLATLMERQRRKSERTVPATQTPLTDDEREMRKAAGWILEDLERTEAALDTALENKWWWALDTRGFDWTGWTEYGEALSIAGRHEEHKLVRDAVALVDLAQVRCREIWSAFEAHHGYDPPPGLRPFVYVDDIPTLHVARDAVKRAEFGLERAVRGEGA
jgi:hypothetical protein